MAQKYLDSNGLAYFWQKIKAYGNTHWGGGGGSVLDFYPVGSYYETSDTSFDPNTAWGGTWYLEVAGQVHVSGGTGYAVNNGYTDTVNSDDTVGIQQGGSADAIVPSHNHTFTGNNLPNHNHSFTGNALGTHDHGTGNSTYSRFVIAEDGDAGALGKRTIKNGTGTSYTNNVHSAGVLYRKGTTQGVSAGTPSGTIGDKSAGKPSGTISAEGESVTNKNLQPYIAVNRWHRTA